MKPPSGQIPFDLPVAPRFGREDFLVSPSNERAFALFERWPDWPARTLLLLGPTGSGKSHLAAIWAERTGAAVVPASALGEADLPTLAAGGAAVIEDADHGRLPERELFHLFNMLRERDGFLALTARSWPDAWGLSIPDLLSRLRLAPAVEIGEPDDALIRAVLVKLFFDRQIVVDETVVEYLALRIERSLDAARRIVDSLDREALAERRPVTRPMAAEVLRREGLVT